MDLKKIGSFLKKIRQEKKLTQEQAAEIFGVSGRTVSRWETGTNMPDLSILIQIAEYYSVDIKEILNGERRNESMDSELKETLLKVADYSELEKEKSLKAGNTAFMLMFSICTIMVIIQMMLTVDLKVVLGETAAAVTGSAAYIFIMVKNGLWESGQKKKNTLSRDMIISILCAGIFSIVYMCCLFKMGAEQSQIVHITLLFFIGIMIVGFSVLRVLAYMSEKQKNSGKGQVLIQTELVKIFTAQDNVQAEMIIQTLKEHGIPNIKEDLGNAGIMNLYGGNSKFGEIIYVRKEDVKNAEKVLTEIGLHS